MNINEKIEKIIKNDFNSSFWNIRENSIEQLALYDFPDMPKIIFNNIKDKYGAVLFLNYLSITLNPNGLYLLFKYIKDNDKEIQTLALSILKKYKIELLDNIIIKLLKETDDNIISAALILIENHKLYKFIPNLIEIIPHFYNNKKILIKFLNVVIELKDIRFLKILLILINSDDSEIVCKTISSLVFVNNIKFLNYFYKLLENKNPQIRKSAVWALGKSKKKKIIKKLIQHYDSENDFNVKQEILKRIAIFNSSKVIIFLLKEAISSKNITIKNMATWFLDNFDKNKRYKIYIKQLFHIKNNESRNGIIILLGKLEYKDSTSKLIKLLYNKKLINLKASIIEALGYSNNIKVINILEKFIKNEDYLISYTSVISICKLSLTLRKLFIIKYLELEEENNEIIIQTILQYLLMIIDKIKLQEKIWQAIIKKSLSKNVNIKYYAIQLLKKSENPKFLKELFILSTSSELNKDIKTEIENTIFELLDKNINYLFKHYNLKNKNLINYILLNYNFSENHNKIILNFLLNLSEQNNDTLNQTIIKYIRLLKYESFNILEKKIIESENQDFYLNLIIQSFKNNNIILPETIVKIIKLKLIKKNILLDLLTFFDFKNKIDILFYFYIKSEKDKNIKKIIGEYLKNE